MLFQDAPPDTSRYMLAGYIIFFVISALYVLSLAVRRRNLEQDLKTLESIEAEGKRPPARRQGPGSRPAASLRKQNRKKVTRRK